MTHCVDNDPRIPAHDEVREPAGRTDGKRALDSRLARRLVLLATRLLDQERARVIVTPMQHAPGFWFGGGNMIREPSGSFVLVGRFRNYGDSRTGVKSGERGLECALFRAGSFHEPFQKIQSWSKTDLSRPGTAVTSIEGSALRQTPEKLELYISTEKAIRYPAAVAGHQKPGTGVWSIDRMTAPNVDALGSSENREVLSSDDPVTLHVKDPVVADDGQGDARIFFCTHPFTWSCSFTGLAVHRGEEKRLVVENDYVLRRGHVWDVAAARVTDRLHIPSLGPFANLPPLSLYFYDGAECVREHEQNARAVKRPRGYSCEELGGLAWGWDDAFPVMQPLSVLGPLFVSPHGTGCSRYVSTLSAGGAVFATWQQSQPDGSQALVGHSLTTQDVEQILVSGG